MDIGTKLAVAEFSPEALHKLADHYQSLADQFRAAAERKAAALGIERDSERRRVILLSVPDTVAGYRAAGLSIDAAISAAAVAAGVPEETVIALVRRDRRQKEHRAREARDSRIIEAVEAGRSRAEVAREHGLSQSRVSRIVSERAHRAEALDRQRLEDRLSSPGGCPARHALARQAHL